MTIKKVAEQRRGFSMSNSISIGLSSRALQRRQKPALVDDKQRRDFHILQERRETKNGAKWDCLFILWM